MVEISIVHVYNLIVCLFSFIQCKEWSFLLRELPGTSLGTGDYGLLLIDHAPMLLRRFLSKVQFSCLQITVSLSRLS